ncbi:MAG: hypothetical protein EOO51_15065, partial [Flavobacterium sp.]
MRQKLQCILLLAVSSLFLNVAQAQTIIFDQNMLTQQSFDTFTPISISGTAIWHASSPYGAVCSGYVAGQNFENEDWLVSPPMNLLQTDNVKLTFSHTRGSAAVVNVGVAEGW